MGLTRGYVQREEKATILNYLRIKGATSPENAVIMEDSILALFMKQRVKPTYIVETPGGKFYIDEEIFNKVKSEGKYDQKTVAIFGGALLVIFVGSVLLAVVAILVNYL